MKRLLPIFTLLLVMLCGCKKYDLTPIWDKLNEHESRISALEELCKRLNTNIESLQSIITALEQNDYVTKVVSIMDGDKEVGYTIHFSKSKAVTIYHGKDGDKGDKGDQGDKGEDGAPGANGGTPNIGVKRDTDGVYYWTLDGEWLLDDSGNKIPASGPKGDSGDKGSDGNNGNDGITPKLKIENNYWYVSYDDGETWTELGKATGEDGEDGKNGQDGKPGADGENGANGENGDSFFQSVDTSNENYIILTLADGTMIKIPTWKAFEELQALVNQINSNLSALQTIVDAIQNNDYVTSVTPVTENGKVIGYSIAFSKSGSIVIYHGQDGKDGDKGDKGDQGDKGEDGAPGANGGTPNIGVKRDTDGVYYWTLDGEWLLDDSGNKIPASGPKGDSGDKGSDGNNGNDGITPKLKIENNYWYVSYDDGETWTELGKATGEDGEDGKNGQDGSCFFKSIDISHSEFIIFTLTNGEQIIIPTSQGVSKEGLEDVYASTYGVIPGTVDMAKMNILLTEAKGKTVRFNDGVYVFPSHITVPSDISFIGNTKTVFKLAENSGSNVLFYIREATNVTISRIFIDGGLSSQPDPESKDDILDKNNHIGNRYGIWCEKSRRIKIQDVEIYGWNLCGVYCKNNDSGGGETGRFYHAVEITNSSFYYNYYGFWADQYGEYNKINASNFGDNFIGVRNEGGNNMYVGCFFNGNYCGFALNGENIKNESHGGCYSCTYNHNSVTGLGGGIAIYANHSTVGWNFNGQNIWYGAVTLKDCKGIIFNSNIWGNVQFSSKDSQGRKKMNLVTNTYFYTNPQSIYDGSDGSTYFESCIDGTAAN